MSVKRRLIGWLRETGLLMHADYIRYLVNYVRTWSENRRIEKELPAFRFPPSYLAYDAYSSCGHSWYLDTGNRAAKAIWKSLSPQLPVQDEHSIQIVEWGCGPARIIRHLPECSSRKDCEFIGTDYNSKTIAWCRANVSAVRFEHNDLAPPLPLKDAFIDALYCISVFTHLSEEMHRSWTEEIVRILRPGGVFLLALNGDRFKPTLSAAELSAYEAGELVVRGNVLEGSRTYLAFHPPAFVRNELLAELEILIHDTNPDPYISSGQDIWLARKPASPKRNES